MAIISGTRRLVPSFRIWIGGSELPPKAAADLISVVVHEDVEAPSMFTLQLVNWDPARLKVTWADDDLFAEGNEVRIQMGYVDRLQTLLVGEITGLEPEFRAGEVPMVTIRGYDRRHRLLRGRKTRSFVRVKDSDIATEIANALRLTAEVEDTGVTLEYVLQHNQTDMEFLQERAGRIGYELLVDDKTLRFRRRRTTTGEVLTLARDGDLIEFYPRSTTLTQVGQLSVRGWNPLDKTSLIAQAAAGDEATTMGGRTTGPAASDDAFGRAGTASVDRPVSSRAEADQIARSRFNEMALAYVSGDGLCAGRTDLRAGTVVRIDGLGRRFSGRYYVIATRHAYDPGQGYRTGFSVRRNAT